jgi:hypothetical protein
MDALDYKNEPKTSIILECPFCHYTCFRKNNFDRHLRTKKHKRLAWIQMDYKNEPKTSQNEPTHNKNDDANYYDCECGNRYKHRQGLSKHKQKCPKNGHFNKCPKNEHSYIDITDSNIILQLIKQNDDFKGLILEQNKTILDQNNKLFDICKNGTNTTLINTNSHNKTFNLNVFLNEHCKDAMNIMDFVDSLKLQLSDLENVGKLGFVEGISNIIVKNLKALDVHKRPVHCSDSKREVMYIKDENKWEKDNDEKKKLRKVIKHIAHKNSKLIPEFRAKYPDCGKSTSKKSDQYNKLVIEAMGGSGDNDCEKENKIIKKIAKEVTIDKNTEID